MNMLESVNATAVTGQDLLRLTEKSAAHRRDHAAAGRDGMVGMFLIAEYANDCHPPHVHPWVFATALYYRMNALAALVQDDHLPGWTLPEGPDGGTLTQESVFHAAAAQPLIERDGYVVFDLPSFLDRVLRLAPAEGRG